MRFCLSMILVVVSVVSAAGESGAVRESRKAASELVREADRLIQEFRIDEALKVLKTAEQLDPQAADIVLRMGNCYSLKEQYDEAQACFEAGLRIHPDEPRLLHNMGLLFFKQKKYDRALNYFQRTLAVRDWHPDANFYIGLIHEQAGDLDKALHHYVQELNHNPANVKAVHRLDWIKRGRAPQRGSRVPFLALLGIWAVALAGLVLLQWKLRRSRVWNVSSRGFRSEKTGGE